MSTPTQAPVTKPQSPIERRLEVGASGKMMEVRSFADPQLQASITNVLNAATTNSVVLQVEKNKSGINAAIAAKIDGHWSVAAAWKRDDWGDALGTSIKFEW